MEQANKNNAQSMTRRSACKLLGITGSIPFIQAAHAASPAETSFSNNHIKTPPPTFTKPPIPPIEPANTHSNTPTDLLRLDGSNSTFLLIVRKTGLPEIAYWGKKLPAQIEKQSVFSSRAPDTPDNGPDQWRPLIPVLETIGGWNLDEPGLITKRPDGTDWATDFQLTDIQLPTQQIILSAEDKNAQLAIKIIFRMDKNDILTSQTSITNLGKTSIDVARLVSGTYLLPDTISNFGVMHGAWSMEWGLSPTELQNGSLVVESRRNRTHDHFPGMMAGAHCTTQNEGAAYGFQLGWSGGHRIGVERMEDSRYRLMLGEYLYPGEGNLQPSEKLLTPEAYGCYSSEGYSGIARAFQAYAREHIVRWPNNKMKPRPVLLNSWEGNQFNLNEQHLRQQIDIAATLGVERFVLDDGWFGARRNDHQGLGDWQVATSVFPQGLRPLADYVHQKNMEFGLWYEPEMANIDSYIYRAHPDWVLQLPGRPLLTARNQVVLDISRPEVSDHLFNIISKEVTDIGIDYIKWDFNRDLLDAGDAHGRAAYRPQVLAIYALWDKLHQAHPALEIESCSSGGGRADWGALRHTQRVWTSDNTSAIDRLSMQRHAWHFLPPELTGAHISAVPNGIDGRTTALDYRAAIAIFGHLGLELNTLHLSPEEKQKITQWVALHKRLRPILHHGLAQFSNDNPCHVVQGVTTPNLNHGVYLVAQKNWPQVRRPAPVCFSGLDAHKNYRMTIPAPQTLVGNRPSPDQQKLYKEGLVLSGSLLANMGIFLPQQKPQNAFIIEFQAV